MILAAQKVEVRLQKEKVMPEWTPKSEVIEQEPS